MTTAIALALTAHVAATCPATRATVRALGISAPADAETIAWSVQGNACRERPLLRLTGTREGVVVSNVTLRPQLELEKRGYTAANDARVGEPVDLRAAWVPFRAPTLRAVDGMVARRDLSAGQVLGPLDLKRRMDARKGDTVAIVVTRGELVLTTEGRLLADASLDAPTRAVNPITGAVLRGVLIDANTMEVR